MQQEVGVDTLVKHDNQPNAVDMLKVSGSNERREHNNQLNNRGAMV
jgi:hypothetical protein